MQNIINHIQSITGRELGCYSASFLKKSINQRVDDTQSNSLEAYFELIKTNPTEIAKLLNSLNISYSLFFRSPLDFMILERFILPDLYHKCSTSGKTVRIWSTSCADGQEPYSLAMIVNELRQKYSEDIKTKILATDISEIALARARNGNYIESVLSNVKYSYITNFFEKKGQIYNLDENIKKMVEFDFYDIFDPNTTSPPSAIFGNFDIVICCNLLIYYKPDFQKKILKKIHMALESGGYLMVDNSEILIVKQTEGFRLYSGLGNIFIKI
jgi:chemotaxis protein methyltransferase CheR